MPSWLPGANARPSMSAQIGDESAKSDILDRPKRIDQRFLSRRFEAATLPPVPDGGPCPTRRLPIRAEQLDGLT
jgi:hypothetical protein